MKNRIGIVLVFSSFLFLKSNAQFSNAFIGDTKMVFQSEDIQGKPFEANTYYATMSLNTNNGDFMLTADLSTLKTGDSKLDSVLINYGSIPLSFKGNINENISKFNEKQNDEKMYDMAGILTINGVFISCTAQYDPLAFADKSDAMNYRLDFKLSVDAGRFKIKNLEGKITKQITLEIASGKLNIQS